MSATVESPSEIAAVASEVALRLQLMAEPMDFFAVVLGPLAAAVDRRTARLQQAN